MTERHFEIKPFGQGHGSRPDQNTIVLTFPMTEQMKGWRMDKIELDPAGFFMTVTWKKDIPESPKRNLPGRCDNASCEKEQCACKALPPHCAEGHEWVGAR